MKRIFLKDKISQTNSIIPEYIMSIWCENNFIHKGGVSSKLFQSFSRFQSMYSVSIKYDLLISSNENWCQNECQKQNYLMRWSKDELTTWLLSLENCKHVIPLEWAFSIFLRHWPELILQTLTLPACEPVTNISLSLENAIHKTACSIIIKFSYKNKLTSVRKLFWISFVIERVVYTMYLYTICKYLLLMLSIIYFNVFW